SGVADTPAWTVEGAGTNSHLGTTVAGAGDVNGDGYADVIIGEPQYSDEGRPERGRALLFLGGKTGLSPTPAWQALGAVAYMHLGYTTCGVGDLDGDGLDDVAVGSPQYTEGKRIHLGAVEVYRGTRDGCESSAAWRAIGSAPDAHLGFCLTSGDFNGDHIRDLVVSAPLYGDSVRERGLLLAYLGQRRQN
ncbi:MAG: integrin alpha, partial [Candidatus Latescibacteria bacterium]|nr:integrin alpha [Candidatus Latescibacterota bacterium]